MELNTLGFSPHQFLLQNRCLRERRLLKIHEPSGPVLNDARNPIFPLEIRRGKKSFQPEKADELPPYQRLPHFGFNNMNHTTEGLKSLDGFCKQKDLASQKINTSHRGYSFSLFPQWC